jgi:hypothetical protein
MELTLNHIKLFSPDELLSYWFVTYDFAGALGLEYSRDAAKILKRALPPGGAKIDYEADVVTLRISGNDRVIPTLMAIYQQLGWDTAELIEIEPQILAFKRPRPRKVAVGDVFLVPVAPGLFGLGQVLDIHHKAPTVAIFTRLGSSADLERFAISEGKPLTILHIGGNSLYKGQWRIIGSSDVHLDPSCGPGGNRFDVGSTSWGGDGPIVDLLKAYAGSRSWEEGYRDPNELRKLVLP